MKTTFSKSLQLLSTFCVVLWACAAAQAQAPLITSFSGSGVLLCSNLVPGSVATVEWASSVTGPWTNNWAGLDAVTVASNGMFQVSVPMFYRVRGMAYTTNATTPDGMALIPAGSFTMGDTLDGESDALPLHTVYVSAFYMDPYLVTLDLWQTVTAWNGGNGYSYDFSGSGKAGTHPVQWVDWYDAVKWCNARSQKEGLTPCYYTDSGLTVVYKTGQVWQPYVNWGANGYRLPTEAEWEKAARAGLSGQRFPWGNTISESQGNYYGYTGYSYDLGPDGYNATYAVGGFPYTSPVGSFAANGYGLYDMEGNLWELCWDWYSGTYYSSSPGRDPRGPSSSSNGHRVFRGGCWLSNAAYCGCAVRAHNLTTVAFDHGGFRCVRGL
jgi:sulfatase modifying factor 1